MVSSAAEKHHHFPQTPARIAFVHGLFYSWHLWPQIVCYYYFFFTFKIFDHFVIVFSAWAALICLDWHLQSQNVTLWPCPAFRLFIMEKIHTHAHRLLSPTRVSGAVAVINWRTNWRVTRYQGAAANLSVCQRGSGKSNTACSDRLNYKWLVQIYTHTT